MAEGVSFVSQGKANQSGPQAARTATKAVSNMRMVAPEDNQEVFRGYYDLRGSRGA